MGTGERRRAAWWSWYGAEAHANLADAPRDDLICALRQRDRVVCRRGDRVGGVSEVGVFGRASNCTHVSIEQVQRKGSSHTEYLIGRGPQRPQPKAETGHPAPCVVTRHTRTDIWKRDAERRQVSRADFHVQFDKVWYLSQLSLWIFVHFLRPPQQSS